MYRSLVRPACFLLTFALVLSLRAQEPPQPPAQPEAPRREESYREYFKKPEKALEYWAALRYEIEVGKFNLAAADLREFLNKKPTNEELLQIVDRDGMSAFLRLLTIPETRQDAKPLVERVTAAVKNLRKDRERIRLFIRNLSGTPEEREFATAELHRSGALAVPDLIDALCDSAGKPEHTHVLYALLELGRDALRPIAAALDTTDAGLKVELLALLERRADPAAVVYLWYPAASLVEKDLVHETAWRAIRNLLGVKEDRLPIPKVALTQEANRYYDHRVQFHDTQRVAVWEWDGRHVVPRFGTPGEAEQYYGLRFARQALDLDPTYEPAQVVFLSLAVEKGFERAGVDHPLEQAAPEVKQLLQVVNPALVNAALDRALKDHRLGVILGTARALGDFGDVLALRPSTQRDPPLVRALYYPDRRVQLAAADALLRIPNPGGAYYGARVVEILRRTLAADFSPRALVGDFNVDRGHLLAQTLKQIGLESVVVPTGRQLLGRLNRAADVDVILLDADIPDPPLPHLLAQLRGDVNAGLLPVFITVPPDAKGKVPDEVAGRLDRLVRPYRNVWLIPASLDPRLLKQDIEPRIAQALGKPLTPDERQANAGLAIRWLHSLAVREAPGFDVRPASEAIYQALHDESLATLAIETTGRLPGDEPQHQLVNVVFRNPRPQLQAAAAAQLARHIQEHGRALRRNEVAAVFNLYQQTTDAKLRNSLGLVAGSLRPSAGETGQRLERFQPERPRANEEGK